MIDPFNPISEMVDLEADDPHTDECSCPNDNSQYLLHIEEGGVYLVHKACGKQPRGDYHDLITLDSLPVTVKELPYGGCDGSAWHGEHRCDCGTYLNVTIAHLAVMHDDQPYLIGRDYADCDGTIWRVTDLRDRDDQPQLIVLPEGAGEPCPLPEVVTDFGPLTLQPTTTKEISR
ncbi:phiSA1p31-related protein [Streptomyces sp. NPDC059524]|uniref:phiSA1p31-related protein n=1 Tax=Streptomyces sp. NPDC059524 TaxID=3346856 RepID=UPI003699D2FA